MSLKSTDETKNVEVPIIDNPEVQPDTDFYVELYDLKTGLRMEGDDTECKVTVLDDDFPGYLGFEITDVKATRK